MPDVNQATANEPDDDHRGALEQAFPSLAPSIRKVGFWAGIGLPFLHVPVLLTGLSTSIETLVFLGLLALNLGALYVGHSYRR
ncbi:hypothetical protein [Natronobacterium texcoconense]|uniref:Uncharacterized protein n=1 Tax=Natronobacterium texcoconense TaxID=1095778 RepID=A0A1H1EFN7_NATTX|nr:hypothetical protein [Natronobacterium texcoconense]SDQ87562.1 hypothetical protein SAMN04489842_1567 [Natronobacterium texcoconense]